MFNCHEYIDDSLVRIAISMGHPVHAVAIVDIGAMAVRCQRLERRDAKLSDYPFYKDNDATNSVSDRLMDRADKTTRRSVLSSRCLLCVDVGNDWTWADTLHFIADISEGGCGRINFGISRFCVNGAARLCEGGALALS